jgi:hypothetical protein
MTPKSLFLSFRRIFSPVGRGVFKSESDRQAKIPDATNIAKKISNNILLPQPRDVICPQKNTHCRPTRLFL